MTFAVLAEDDSDAQSLAILVKRISKLPNAKIFRKGFKGCGDLRKNNTQVINFIDMAKLERKCASFRPLKEFVERQ
jgi:hypothetical protein